MFSIVTLVVVICTIGFFLIANARHNALQNEMQENIDRFSNYASLNSAAMLNTVSSIQSNTFLLAQLQTVLDEDWGTILSIIHIYRTEIHALESIVQASPVLRHIRIFADNDRLIEIAPVLHHLDRAGDSAWVGEPVSANGAWYFDYADLTTNVPGYISERYQVAHISKLQLLGHELVLEVASHIDYFLPSFFTTQGSGHARVFVDQRGNIHYSEHMPWEREEIASYLSELTHSFQIIGNVAIAMAELEDGVGWLLELRYTEPVNREIIAFNLLFGLGVSLLGYLFIKLSFNAEMKKEILFKNSQLMALNNQIDAHFLYNTLETIKMLAELEGNTQISDAITNLGKIFRYNLGWQDSTATLREELDYTRQYLSLANLRFDVEIPFVLDIDENLLEISLPRMTLQPIVENSLKHGYHPELSISLYAYQNVDTVVVEIRDNGLGIPQETLTALKKNPKAQSRNTTGVGLRNIEERIKLNYGTMYGIVLDSQAGEFTHVRITLPAQ